MPNPEPTFPAPSLSEVEQAARELAPVLVRTPLVPGHDRAERLLLKPELLQAVGSFKLRGVFYAVASMAEEERQRGLMTVSAGNTAQALAWAGRHFGVPARSLMPESAPRTKIERMRALGGTPVLVPVAELFAFLKEQRWLGEPYAFVHPWTDRRLLTGHGTLGLEIAADLPEVDSVFIPVGGGGLLVGVASALRALRPEVKVFAVEPTGCPSLHAALAAGAPVEVACKTMCDGIAVPYITDEMFPHLAELVDRVVLVEEADVRRAVRELLLDYKMVVEGAGAIAYAAALAVPPDERGETVVVLSGGSLDRDLLIEILREA